VASRVTRASHESTGHLAARPRACNAQPRASWAICGYRGGPGGNTNLFASPSSRAGGRPIRINLENSATKELVGSSDRGRAHIVEESVATKQLVVSESVSRGYRFRKSPRWESVVKW